MNSVFNPSGQLGESGWLTIVSAVHLLVHS